MASKSALDIKIDINSMTVRALLELLQDLQVNGIDWGSLGKFTTIDITEAAPGTPVLQRLYQQGIVKAWAYCTVAGAAVTVAAGQNVSSVTYSAVGRYIPNFATNLTDANYSLVGFPSDAAVAVSFQEDTFVQARTTSKFGLIAFQLSGTILDVPAFSFVVFGN